MPSPAANSILPSRTKHWGQWPVRTPTPAGSCQLSASDEEEEELSCSPALARWRTRHGLLSPQEESLRSRPQPLPAVQVGAVSVLLTSSDQAHSGEGPTAPPRAPAVRWVLEELESSPDASAIPLSSPSPIISRGRLASWRALLESPRTPTPATVPGTKRLSLIDLQARARSRVKSPPANASPSPSLNELQARARARACEMQRKSIEASSGSEAGASAGARAGGKLREGTGAETRHMLIPDEISQMERALKDWTGVSQIDLDVYQEERASSPVDNSERVRRLISSPSSLHDSRARARARTDEMGKSSVTSSSGEERGSAAEAVLPHVSMQVILPCRVDAFADETQVNFRIAVAAASSAGCKFPIAKEDVSVAIISEARSEISDSMRVGVMIAVPNVELGQALVQSKYLTEDVLNNELAKLGVSPIKVSPIEGADAQVEAGTGRAGGQKCHEMASREVLCLKKSLEKGTGISHRNLDAHRTERTALAKTWRDSAECRGNYRSIDLDTPREEHETPLAKTRLISEYPLTAHGGQLGTDSEGSESESAGRYNVALGNHDVISNTGFFGCDLFDPVAVMWQLRLGSTKPGRATPHCPDRGLDQGKRQGKVDEARLAQSRIETKYKDDLSRAGGGDGVLGIDRNGDAVSPSALHRPESGREYYRWGAKKNSKCGKDWDGVAATLMSASRQQERDDESRGEKVDGKFSMHGDELLGMRSAQKWEEVDENRETELIIQCAHERARKLWRRGEEERERRARELTINAPAGSITCQNAGPCARRNEGGDLGADGVEGSSLLEKWRWSNACCLRSQGGICAAFSDSGQGAAAMGKWDASDGGAVLDKVQCPNESSCGLSNLGLDVGRSSAQVDREWEWLDGTVGGGTEAEAEGGWTGGGQEESKRRKGLEESRSCAGRDDISNCMSPDCSRNDQNHEPPLSRSANFAAPLPSNEISSFQLKSNYFPSEADELIQTPPAASVTVRDDDISFGERGDGMGMVAVSWRYLAPLQRGDDLSYEDPDNGEGTGESSNLAVSWEVSHDSTPSRPQGGLLPTLHAAGASATEQEGDDRRCVDPSKGAGSAEHSNLGVLQDANDDGVGSLSHQAKARLAGEGMPCRKTYLSELRVLQSGMRVCSMTCMHCADIPPPSPSPPSRSHLITHTLYACTRGITHFARLAS